MSERPKDAICQTPGWWKVTDGRGDVGYYEFRADGRARGLRGSYWYWCYIQGDWVSMADNDEWLRFANMDPKPTAVLGQHGFIEAVRDHRAALEAARER